jgi:hypothetical protein
MKNEITRRSFLNTSFRTSLAFAGAGLLGPLGARAVEPIKRSGKPRLQLSLAAYSFRQFFTHKDTAKQITLDDFVDYCGDHGCAGAELTSYYFPKGFGDDYLIQLKRHAFLRGIEISGSAVGNNFALPKGPQRDEQIGLVKKWVDHCAVPGAPHIPVFAGPTQDKDISAAKKLCIEALEECGYAGRHGVFLGLKTTAASSPNRLTSWKLSKPSKARGSVSTSTPEIFTRTTLMRTSPGARLTPSTCSSRPRSCAVGRRRKPPISPAW